MNKDIYQPADPGLAPGEARCPGPSAQDIIRKDSDNPPAALLASSYEFIGDEVDVEVQWNPFLTEPVPVESSSMGRLKSNFRR